MHHCCADHIHPPACSIIALRKTALSQSLHFTIPTVSRSGDAPNTFMSRARSHCVGGDDGSAGGVGRGGELGTLSQLNGDVGSGDELARSLSVIVVHSEVRTISRARPDGARAQAAITDSINQQNRKVCTFKLERCLTRILDRDLQCSVLKVESTPTRGLARSEASVCRRALRGSISSLRRLTVRTTPVGGP